MRLIDADAFIAKLDHVPMVQEAIRTEMDTMPTIEQPEIIRCKDCTRYEKKNGRCNLVEGLNVATANSFCSYGEENG